MHEPLTPTDRQLEILALIAQGYERHKVAEILEISPGTVKTHLKELFSRIEASNAAHAVWLATQRGLLSIPQFGESNVSEVDHSMSFCEDGESVKVSN